MQADKNKNNEDKQNQKLFSNFRACINVGLLLLGLVDDYFVNQECCP